MAALRKMKLLEWLDQHEFQNNFTIQISTSGIGYLMLEHLI